MLKQASELFKQHHFTKIRKTNGSLIAVWLLHMTNQHVQDLFPASDPGKRGLRVCISAKIQPMDLGPKMRQWHALNIT